MSGMVVIAQQKWGLVHIATDAAIYTKVNGVEAFGSKTYPIAHLPAAVTALGNGNATVLFGHALSQCRSFDHMLHDASELLPALIEAGDWAIGGQVIIAGISLEHGPSAFTFRLNDDLPATATREEAESSAYWGDRPGTLTKLPDVIMSPVPSDQDVVDAAFEDIDVDADPDVVVWQMQKLLTMQRHMNLPDDVGGIGGHVCLTTVSPFEVTQRVLQTWPDEIGGLIRPAPIDWTEWHRAHPKPESSTMAHVLRSPFLPEVVH